MGPSSHIKHARYSNTYGPSTYSKPAPGYTAKSIKAENARRTAAALAKKLGN